MNSYKITLVNEDRNERYYESDFEPYKDSLGQLYRVMRKEYGRCTGHVYITTKEEEAVPIGWTFVKRERYDDRESFGHPMNRENSFLQTAWVSVYDGIPVTIYPKRLDIRTKAKETP